MAIGWPKRVFDLFLIARSAASDHEDRSDDVSSKMQEMRWSYIVGGIALWKRPLCGLCQNRNCQENEPHTRVNGIYFAVKARAGFESAFSRVHSSSQQIANR